MSANRGAKPAAAEPAAGGPGQRDVSLIRRFVAYPALIAAAWVLRIYVDPIPPLYILVRPVLVAVVVVLVIQLVFSIVTRNRDRGAFIATVIALLLVDWTLGVLVMLAAVVPLVVRTVRARRLQVLDWPGLTRFLNVAAVLVLISTLVIGAGRGVVPMGPATPLSATVPGAEVPDIYLVMLDGYPRGDTLARDFAFDNEPFLQAMEAQGFDVARDAHSNYNITWLTLASMFNVEHLDTLLPNPPKPIEATLARLTRIINEGDALQAARGAGYEIVAISGGMVSASLTSADRFIDTGQVNNVEAPLLRAGVLPYMLPAVQADFLHGELRDRFNASVGAVRGLANEPVGRGRPRLVWAHLFAPHPPIVFDEMGAPSSDDGCYPLACGLFDQVYDFSEPRYLQEELRYVNEQLEALAADIIANNDRPAVIVLFSDHGFRHNRDDLEEMVHSLFLSYAPDRAQLFPETASPINVLPTLLNRYAGTQIPLAVDGAFVADFRKFAEQKSYFPLVRVTP